MFFEPPETQYDLRWQMLGVNVRVHPWFWIMSALLGRNALEEGFEYLLVWMGCVFVSILCHELGHIFMGRLFGSDGHIVLYSFGGLAVGSTSLRSRWQRIMVCLAGPGAQLVLLAVIWALTSSQDFSDMPMSLLNIRPMPPLAAEAVWDLIQINLFWAILNLAPIVPLDGGQVSRDFLIWLIPGRGEYFAHGVSFLCAGLLAINALAGAAGHPLIPFLPGGIYVGILFGVLAYSSFTAMHQTDRWA